MPSKKTMGREYLLRILSFCLSVSQKGVDPFEVEVQKLLESIRKYLPEWKLPEDFNLDAETLNRISSIVELQGKWLRHLSSSLYIDPLLIELKLKILEPEALAEMFSKCWRPIVEMEQLVPKRVKEAIDYWNLLPPIEERWPELEVRNIDLNHTTMESLRELGIISDISFEDVLKKTWRELKKASNKRGVPFWNFINTASYSETVRRAYLASFLVTYGYAKLEINPLEEEIILIPLKEQRNINSNGQGVSIPLSIDRETWERMNKN